MFVGGCEEGAAQVSGGPSDRDDGDIRGVIVKVTEEGKSSLVGSLPGMLSRRWACG